MQCRKSPEGRCSSRAPPSCLGSPFRSCQVDQVAHPSLLGTLEWVTVVSATTVRDGGGRERSQLRVPSYLEIAQPFAASNPSPVFQPPSQGPCPNLFYHCCGSTSSSQPGPQCPLPAGPSLSHNMGLRGCLALHKGLLEQRGIGFGLTLKVLIV